MSKVYGITCSSYDGCNGWTTSRLDKIFSTKESAQKFINDKHYDGIHRYGITEIKVSE